MNALSGSANVSVVADVAAPRRRLAARLWSGILAAWGAFIGLAPHLLHHVGPANADEASDELRRDDSDLYPPV